jgi:hypothetical protein
MMIALLLMLACVHTAESDFDEIGFECVIQYLCTARVEGVTKGVVVVQRLQSALQAAQIFSLKKFASAATAYAAQLASQFLIKLDLYSTVTLQWQYCIQQLQLSEMISSILQYAVVA